MGKLIVSAIIIALAAIGFGGCAVYPHHNHGYGYQNPPYYSGGYRYYGSDRDYGNYWGRGRHGYGNHGHHHGGRYDDD